MPTDTNNEIDAVRALLSEALRIVDRVQEHAIAAHVSLALEQTTERMHAMRGHEVHWPGPDPLAGTSPSRYWRGDGEVPGS